MNNRIKEYINNPDFDRELRKRIFEWSQSPFFIDFLNSNKEKILKKLKTAKEREDKYDIGLELYIAFIFTTTNCQVTYEPDIGISASPDFKIKFWKQSFFCEVTRLRNWIGGTISNDKMYKKCGDIICEKVIQAVPDEINIIYIRKRGMAPDYRDLERAVDNLFNWIEKDPESFLKKIKKTGMNSIEEFKKYWRQVSAIIIARVQNRKFIPDIWDNPNAARLLPETIKLKINEAISKPFRYDR